MAHEHFESIFTEPESAPNPDEFADITFTSYHATATRRGRQWTVNVHGLPDGHAATAQGADWIEARHNAHEVVTGLLGEIPQAVGIDLIPDDAEAAAALRAVVPLRVARADAEQAERDAVTYAAQLLISKGWTTRDAGAALSLSPQRISQLAPRTEAEL